MKSSLNSAYRLFAIVCTVMVLMARPAHAYLDPGTGSYATQIVLAGVVGALFSAKLILQGIARFFRSLVPSGKTVAPAAATGTTANLACDTPTPGTSSAE